MNQQMCLVSDVRGTTTDPVLKAMELIPFGPVLFIDTAGLEDDSELGKLRVEKTLDMLKRTDFAIYLMDVEDLDMNSYGEMKHNFKKYNIPYITVVNKIDKVDKEKIEHIKNKFKNALFISSSTGEGIANLREELINKLQQGEEENPIIGDLLPYGSTVIMVVPIDSEAPKGRIILPQVQCIRDCLDYGIKSYVVRDTELESALEDIKNIDLVITDSQAFKEVDKIIPKDIKLTSFSILFARQKGELDELVKGARKIEKLNKDSKVLICESCTHNVSHEDIGRVKIPKMLNKKLGCELNYEFKVGHDFPDNIEDYDLVIHCGACMVNRKSMINKINMCREKNVNITNYGVVIAYLNGILDRSIEIYYK